MSGCVPHQLDQSVIQWMEACMPGKDGASNLANVKAYQSMDPGMMVISHDSQLNWFFSITGSDTLHPNSPWICPEANSSFSVPVDQQLPQQQQQFPRSEGNAFNQHLT